MSREQRSINLDGEVVSYTLQRSSRRRRTIQLQIDSENGLKVLVPHTLSAQEIEEFLRRRGAWIREHHAAPLQPQDEFDWENGGDAKFMGQNVTIFVNERDPDDNGRDLAPSVVKSLEGDAVNVTIPPNLCATAKAALVREWLIGWYRQEAWDYLKSRVLELGKIMGVQPRQLKLSNARKRWGSCSGKQSVNLNWRLIMLDADLIDYVIVHELAHLIELNHSPAFWKVVASVLPEHRDLRRQLKESSPTAFD